MSRNIKLVQFDMAIKGQQTPLPFFEPESAWSPPDLSSLPSWDGARRVAVDVETKDDDLVSLGPGVRRAGCYIVGYSVAIEDGPQFYVPLRHGGGGNVDCAQGLAYLRYQASNFVGDVAGAGLQYDLDWLEAENIRFPKARFFRDVQVAAPLVNELHQSYSLENIAIRAGIPGKDEAVLMSALSSYGYSAPNAKRGLHALPAKLVGPYGEQDARLPLQLLSRLETEIDEQDLWGVYDLESRVLPILVKMRRRGVRISMERLEAVEKWARAQQEEALGEVRRITGVSLLPAEVTRPEALAKAVRAMGVEPPRTRTGKVSVTAALLDGLKHPAATALNFSREMARLRSMFANSIREHAIFAPDGDARIHCTFNQLRKSKDEDAGDDDSEGAAYGRLSCVDPNLQQQPSPDKKPQYGKMWRSIYLPERGALWGALDYSQQEPRMGVHFAVKCGAYHIGREAYAAALKAQAQYKNDPKTDFHDMMTRMVYGEDTLEREGKDKFKLLRRFCKEIQLGLSYGMGGAKLCRKLGLPTKVIQNQQGNMIEVAGDEGQAIIDRFNKEVPFIKKTAWFAQQRAKGLGYITTLSGRRCRFPKDELGNFDWCQKSFNRLIQGSSADQTKTALVQMDEAGYFVQLQVHDEVDGSFANDNEAHEAAKIMENCIPLEVPFRVDVEIGPSWGEAA